MSKGLTIEQQIALVERQIAEWREVAFNAEVAHRVHARLKSDPAVLARHVETMTKAEHAIDELTKIRAELERMGSGDADRH